MEREVALLMADLDRAAGDDAKQARALQALVRAVASAPALPMAASHARRFCELARSARSREVRGGAVLLLAALADVAGADRASVLPDPVLDVAMDFVGKPPATPPALASLQLLALALESASDAQVDALATRGVAEVLLRHLQHVPADGAASAAALVQVRERCLAGLLALASRSTRYARMLHERDVWAAVAQLFENSRYASSLSLLLVRAVIAGAIADSGAEPQQPVEALARPLSSQGRSSSSHHRSGHRSRARTRLASDAAAAAAAAATNSSSDDADADDDGLETARDLDPETLDAGGAVCLAVDRQGVMSMLLSVAQMADQEALGALALGALALLAPHLHKAVPRAQRVTIVRVLLAVVERLADSARLVAAALALDSLLGQPRSRRVVLGCATLRAVSGTGLRLLARKEAAASDAVRAFVQLLFHVSQLPGGSAELCAQQPLHFLARAVRGIGSARLQLRRRAASAGPSGGTGGDVAAAAAEATGEDPEAALLLSPDAEWSSAVEVTALLTLVNVAAQSPALPPGQQSELRRALASASGRADALGLLATVGAATFMSAGGGGRDARGRVRSREVPRVQARVAQLLLLLLRAARRGRPALGGIYWSPAELLVACGFLALAPHNADALAPLVPEVLDMVRARAAQLARAPDASSRHEPLGAEGEEEEAEEAEEELALALGVLLALSCSVAGMDALTADAERARNVLRAATALGREGGGGRLRDVAARDAEVVLDSLDALLAGASRAAAQRRLRSARAASVASQASEDPAGTAAGASSVISRISQRLGRMSLLARSGGAGAPAAAALTPKTQRLQAPVGRRRAGQGARTATPDEEDGEQLVRDPAAAT